ncbi:hypothetical protein ABTY23_20055, partial [Streptomyces sp. NPDC096068]
VACPVTRADWTHRRAGAPVARMTVERFDPARDPAGRTRRPGTLAGDRTLIRYTARRVQADNGTWVRDFTLNLPVRRDGSLPPERTALFQRRLQTILDTHLNTGYALPASGDQIHVGVRLVDAPRHGEHITLTDTPDGPPPRARQRALDLRHDDGVLLHELLHYLGLPDEYRDPGTLFRRSGSGSAVRDDGVMATARTPEPGGLPYDYLAAVESLADDHLVLRDHPLPPEPAEPAELAEPAEPAGSPEVSESPEVSAPVRYAVDDSFDEEFAALSDGTFPVHAATDRWTVWGLGDDDARVFVAEIPGQGLRGTYADGADRRPAGPYTGNDTDDTDSTSDTDGTDGSGPRPAWNWYLPGLGPVASSPWRDRPLPAPHPVADRPPVDPALTAARPQDPSALPSGARWRQDDAPLHAVSGRDPDEVFGDGLPPGGDRPVHLALHLAAPPADSPHVTLTRAPGATPAPPGPSWRYDVVAPGGVDVNATLDIAAPHPDRQQVVFTGGVGARWIRGAQPLLDGVPHGPYLPNPGFVPEAAPLDDPDPDALPPADADDRWETSPAPLRTVTDYRMRTTGPDAVPFHRYGPVEVAAPDPSADPAAPALPHRPEHTDVRPPLLASDDLTLAVNDAGPGAREAYATQRSVDRANTVLAEIDSKVRLRLDRRVTVQLAPDRSPLLHRVTPEFLGGPPPPECDAFAGHLIGGAPNQLVLRDGEGGALGIRTSKLTSLTLANVHELAHTLTDLADRHADGHLPRPTPEVHRALLDLRRAERADSVGLDVGEAYERATRQPGMAAIADLMGVNGSAVAGIGEAYLIQSIGRIDADGVLTLRDPEPEAEASAPDGRPRIPPYGYHFATTVLTSEDGAAHVTLENRNRVGEERRAVTEAARVNTAAGRTSGTDEASVAAATRGVLPRHHDLWCFQLYGEGRDLHGSVAAPVPGRDAAVMERPLTVVVSGGRTPEPFTRLSCAEGRHTFLGEERFQLNQLARSVARAMLWNDRNGLPLPVVTVTGYGTARMSLQAGWTGAARARNTALAFRQALNGVLEQLQDHRPSNARLSAGDLTITTASGGRDFPAGLAERFLPRHRLPERRDEWPRAVVIGVTT